VKTLAHLLIFAVVFATAAHAQSPVTADFRSVVEKRLAKEKLKLEDVCPVDTNVVAYRIFQDYGAKFVATSDVKYPAKCVFESEEEVAEFQRGLKIKTATIGGRTIELQAKAMDQLLKAQKAAAKRGLTITPRGASSARRGYADTHRIWLSRFEPALNHWTRRGRISAEAAAKARKMTTLDQVAQVIEWEKDELWFSTGFNRSIFSSVAAPGTSQHLSMLALDVTEFANLNVRKILNEHGWYQTIINDTPHFTFLGLDEDELPERGLRLEFAGQFTFWIPNFPSAVPNVVTKK
jgi:hypothetical protein